MSERLFFLDMDAGIDDAVAMTFASGLPNVKIVGVSSVAGNSAVVKTMTNALRVADYIGLDAPVYKGASRPLARVQKMGYFLRTSGKFVSSMPSRRPRGAKPVHGEDGMGDAEVPPPKSVEAGISGPEAIIEAARSCAGEVILVATGPLTNVAMAVILEPALPRLLKQLVIMGGGYGLTKYGTGNVTPFAEFNVFADPDAANLVFDRFDGVMAVGLDVTNNPEHSAP